VILLDLEMPVLDGDGFVARYRARPGRKAAIVVISGSPDAREVAARLGAVDVITKPFDLDMLLERVARWVRPREREGASPAA
jgi:CheY-like chemotaxis protein